MATKSQSGRTGIDIEIDRYKIATYVVYAFGLAFFIFPVLWAISMSVRPRSAVISVPLSHPQRVHAGGLPGRTRKQRHPPVGLELAEDRSAGSRRNPVVRDAGSLRVLAVPVQGKHLTLLGILLFQMIRRSSSSSRCTT